MASITEDLEESAEICLQFSSRVYSQRQLNLLKTKMRHIYCNFTLPFLTSHWN